MKNNLGYVSMFDEYYLSPIVTLCLLSDHREVIIHALY